MQTKQEIIDEIRRTAKENGGRPLGKARFEKETGIKAYDWGIYWARFGDAQKEAGFVPNQLTAAYSTDFLIEKIISLSRKLRKFPTGREIVVESNSDAQFPSTSAFLRLGNKEQLAAIVMEYCKNKNGYDDIVGYCKFILDKSSGEKAIDNPGNKVGEVYLFKSGRHFKIGKTYDSVRRGKELKIQLPEKCELIHSIKTDDPSGIEAYWHKRFDEKRMQGEWFDLSSVDVKAFKRWRSIT